MADADAAPLWRDIVTGFTREDPASLEANTLNFRIHTPRQRSALLASIHDLGFLHPVIVNDRTGRLLDGHERVEAAIATGQPTIPTIHVDLPEDREAEALLLIDPIAAMAEFEQQQMAETLKLVETDQQAINDLLETLASQAGLLAPLDPVAEWEGMPSFQQDDLLAMRQVIVSFATAEDVAAFAKLIGQPITEKTRSLWFPMQTRADEASQAFITPDQVAS